MKNRKKQAQVVPSLKPFQLGVTQFGTILTSAELKEERERRLGA